MLLSAGAYGSVYKESFAGELVAVKYVNLRDENKVRAFNNEALICQRTRNFEYCVQAKKSYIKDGKGCLVMELGERSLFEIVNDISLQELEAACLFRSICIAVKELHDNRIAHLDLKLENILLTKKHKKQMKLKLCDFGCATTYEGIDKIHYPDFKVGAPIYSAPELENRLPFSPSQADCWSLGVILFILLVGGFPMSKPALYLSPDNISLSGLEYCSKEGRDLVTSLLNFNASERLTIDEILAHPWLCYGSECTLNSIISPSVSQKVKKALCTIKRRM